MNYKRANYLRLLAIFCVGTVLTGAWISGAVNPLIAGAFSEPLISSTVHYQVTAELSVKGAAGVGTSVWQTVMGYRPGSSLLVSPKSAIGEAIRIVLPQGEEYFLLRRPRDISPSSFFGLLTMDCVWQGGTPVTDNVQAMRTVDVWQGPCAVRTELPELVRFRDANDPTTIERVSYGLIGNCRDACLSLYAVRTDLDVSREISRFLPWVQSLSAGQDISGNDYSLRYVDEDGPRAFSKIDFTNTGGN